MEEERHVRPLKKDEKKIIIAELKFTWKCRIFLTCGQLAVVKISWRWTVISSLVFQVGWRSVMNVFSPVSSPLKSIKKTQNKTKTATVHNGMATLDSFTGSSLLHFNSSYPLQPQSFKYRLTLILLHASFYRDSVSIDLKTKKVSVLLLQDLWSTDCLVL